MHVLYFLVISVLYNGEPINVEGEFDFDTLVECKYAAGDFVTYVVEPRYQVTVSCERREVNDA